MKNNNGSIIRKLTSRTLGSNKKRNFFITVAITLTAFMMTSVFSVGISLIESINMNRFRLEGNIAHIAFPGRSEQAEAALDLNYVRNTGKSALIGYADLPEFDGTVPMFYIERNTWQNFASPAFTNITGRYAESGNEVMFSRHKLSAMGIENPYVGMEIPIDFTINDSDAILTEIFTLAAIYTEFVSALGSGGTPIFISQDFALRHGQLDNDEWNIQVIFRNQRRAEEYAERLAQDLNLGEDWQLHPAILLGANANHMSTYTGIGILVTFLMFTGFLLIYNVMYVSVSKDVRFYGMLKTLGTTPRQLRRIVNGQVLLLYLIGLPAGLLIAAGASFVIVPALVISAPGTSGTIVSFSPMIYIGGAVFTLLTAYLGAFTSARKAAQVSPIEAVRYVGGQGAKLKARGSAKGKPGKMAFRNVFRERKRAFIVLLSLFLGVTVFTTIMTIVHSLDVDYAVSAIYPHDFTISSIEFEGLDVDFINQVSSVSGVAEIRPDVLAAGRLVYTESLSHYVDWFSDWLTANHPQADASRDVVMEKDLYIDIRGIDTAWLIEWNEQQDNPIDIEAFERGEIILLSQDIFQFTFRISEHESQRLLPVGTALDIEIGIDEQIPASVTIGGFARFRTYSPISFRGGGWLTIFMSAAYLQAHLENVPVHHLNINTAGRQDEEVYNALTDMLGQNRIMISRYEARLMMAETRQMMFVLGTGLSVILGMIGIFNFINVISVGLLVRKREFAALESVGMTKSQMRAMLRWEGAIYWIITIFASLTIGNAIAYGLFNLLSDYSGGQFAGIVYPFIPIAAAYAIIIFICSATPEFAYKSMRRLSLVERLREAE